MLKLEYTALFFSIIGLIIGITIFQIVIPLLRRFKFGQSIRKEGPTRHYGKSGTPTMGGIVIVVISIILFITYLIRIKKDIVIWQNVLLIIIPFIGFAIIGFVDDFLIIVKKNNLGLPASIKFLLQIIISSISYYLILTIRKDNMLNFFGIKIDIGFLYGILIIIGFAGVSNATNLTDGLDGLLAGCSIISICGIYLIARFKGNELVMYFSLSLMVATLCFAIFNFPKASIFMGDVGSLAIGAAIFAMLIALRMEILFIFFGIIYICETISVILQVWFFKKTKGKRLFKMTPIHHHFELLGLKEEQIDVVFWGISLIFTMIGVILGVMVF